MRFFACLLLVMAAIALVRLPATAHAAVVAPAVVHTAGSAPGLPTVSADAISTDPLVPLGRQESSLLNRVLLLLAAASLGAAYLLWRRT